MIIAFTIPGEPQQQGTKVKNRYGAMYDENKHLGPWRRDAIACARDAKAAVPGAQDSIPIFTGPIQVTMVAYFPRPKSHYGTGRNAGVLKPTAPTWHSSAPDCDKVARALGDALTISGLIHDDRLIVAWDACKVYGDPRMEVTVVDADPLIADHLAAEQETLLDA